MKELETKRYILRKPTENDAEIIYEKNDINIRHGSYSVI